MSRDLIPLSERMIADVASGDAGAYERHFAAGCELHEHVTDLPQTGVWLGPDGVRQCMATQNAAWKKSWAFTRFQYSDDIVIMYEQIVWDSYTTERAPMIPAIGVHHYDADGMIDRMDIYITDEDALRATLAP